MDRQPASVLKGLLTKKGAQDSCLAHGWPQTMPKQIAYKNRSLKTMGIRCTSPQRTVCRQPPRTSSQDQPSSQGVASQLHSSHSWRSGTAGGGTCAFCSMISIRHREVGEGARPLLERHLIHLFGRLHLTSHSLRSSFLPCSRHLLRSHWDKTQVWPETSLSGVA